MAEKANHSKQFASSSEKAQKSFVPSVGIGTNNPGTLLDVNLSTSATNSAADVGTLRATSTGTMADGFGGVLNFNNGGTNVATLNWIREGANNSGRLDFWTKSSGNWFHSLTMAPSGRVGIMNQSPNIGAALDVTGTGVNFSSMIVPRDLTARRPTGVNGMIRYNTNLAAFEVYAGGTWATVSTGSGGGSGDFLRNGTLAMTGNFRSGGYYISNDGDNEGLFIDTNGQVGIGTSDPSGSKLHIQGVDDTFLTVTDTGPDQYSYPLFRLDNTGFTAGDYPLGGLHVMKSGNIRAQIMVNHGSNTSSGVLEFGTSNGAGTLNTHVRIDQDGRVGIGTTAPSGILSVAGTGSTANAYFFYDNADVGDDNDGQSTYVYRRAAEGDRYIRTFVDQYNWGNTWTDADHFFLRLTRDYAGYNIVGSYPESYAYSDATRGSPKGFSPNIENSSAVDGAAAGVHFTVHNAANSWPYQAAYINAVSTSSGSTPELVFGQRTGSSAYAERMRIDTLGRLGIGTSTPTALLTVLGTAATNSPISLVRNTLTGATSDGLHVQIDATTPGTSNLFAAFKKSGGTTIGSISGDGAGGVQYNLASDRRLKGNIRDTHYSLTDLLKIRVRDYHYLGHNVDTNGFIAQELYKAYPPAVSKPLDETTQYWQVDYGRLTPLIVKSVQDVYGLCQMSSAQSEELKVRVAATERDIEALKREIQSLREKNENLERKLDRVMQHLKLEE